jgi:hypothetical protein
MFRLFSGGDLTVQIMFVEREITVSSEFINYVWKSVVTNTSYGI